MVDDVFVKLIKRNADGFAINGGNNGDNGQNVNLYNSGNSSQNLQWLIQEIPNVAVRSAESSISQNQISTAPDVKISPNPTEGDLSINLNDYTDQEVDIFITDLSRTVLLTKNLERDHSPILNLDISAYQNGLYILYIKAENHKAVVKKVSLLNGY